MAGCRRCSDPSVACQSFAIRKPSARNSAPLALEVWRGQVGGREGEKEERALCARQFSVIDMNHYRQHGRGWQKASHRFIFGHLFRQKLGQTRSEQGLNVSMRVCQKEKESVQERGTEEQTQGQSVGKLTQAHRQPPAEENIKACIDTHTHIQTSSLSESSKLLSKSINQSNKR